MDGTTLNDLNTNTTYPIVYGLLDKSNIKNQKFFSYKQWDISSGSSTLNALPLNAIYSDYTNLALLGTDLSLNDSRNIDGSFQTIIYKSTYHLFYTKDQLYNTYDISNQGNMKKFLYHSASIFSIPNQKIGYGIQPTSFEFTASTSPYIFKLKDDGSGNIYNTSYDTSSIIDSLTYYEGFNEYFDTSRIDYESANVTYIPGINLSDVTPSASIGMASRFSGNGYITTQLDGEYNRSTEYAISFFISGAAQSADNLVLGKLANSVNSTYPFKIELTTDNKIKFTISSADQLKSSISASISSSWNHIVCQKSGSKMYLHVNGNTPITSSNIDLGYISNTSNLYIGGFSTNTSNLTADLDEIRIFNKSLSTSNVNALKDRTKYGTCLQTNIVGNVFYNLGLVIISSPNPIYNDIINIDNFNAYYKSTKQINEFSALINVQADQFNSSLNSSLLNDDMSTYQSYITGSEFSPYITTIGLYDNNSKLLAIAKLAQPIKKRSDIDLSFLIQIDTDQPLTPLIDLNTIN
jgi:hypothetical protein